MILVFRWFWVLMLTVVAVNLALYRARLRRFEAEGAITRADADRLLRAIAVWLGGLVVALGAVQIAAGWPSPLCVHAKPLTDPFVLASWTVTAIAWAVLAWWMFAAGGAELVARASPVLGQRTGGRPWTPRAVRIGTVCVIVAATLGAILPRLQPMPMICDPAAAFGAG